MNYLKDPYNYNDLFQFLATIWIVVSNVSSPNAPTIIDKRNVATFVLLGQGTKAVLDWLRLFDNTSFYVTLILKTIIDIGYIGMIIIIIFVYIGSALYMLQLNVASTEDADIINPIFGMFLIDTFLNQYLLMLGEFNTDGF